MPIQKLNHAPLCAPSINPTVSAAAAEQKSPIGKTQMRLQSGETSNRNAVNMINEAAKHRTTIYGVSVRKGATSSSLRRLRGKAIKAYSVSACATRTETTSQTATLQLCTRRKNQRTATRERPNERLANTTNMKSLLYRTYEGNQMNTKVQTPDMKPAKLIDEIKKTCFFISTL